MWKQQFYSVRVHEVDDLFLGVIKAGHNGDVQDTAETLWEQRADLEMEVSFLSLDLESSVYGVSCPVFLFFRDLSNISGRR